VDDKVCYARPSIDVVFGSAADVSGTSTLAISLAGAGSGGTEGRKYIKKNFNRSWFEVMKDVRA